MKKTVALIPLLALVVACQQPAIEKQIVHSDGAPAAIGPYSQAVQIGNRLYLSGALGLDPQTGEFVPGAVAEQARQAMENQRAVLTAAGFTFADVVQCQVFLKDLNEYAAFNAVYAEYFDGGYPARAVLEVARIPKDGLVEIMMVAEKVSGEEE